MTTTVKQAEAFNLIGGERRGLGGEGIVSRSPAHPDRVVWSGTADASAVGDAVGAARGALGEWSAMPIEKRADALRAYQRLARERADAMAELICDETGKALWDSQGEAKLLAGKVDITLSDAPHAGLRRVSPFGIELGESREGRCRFRPHGVMSVVGPYNFPAHLPNGHIVPALLMGNTVVFKPSDKTPAVGQALAEMFDEALTSVGAPAGVVNCVHGGGDVASSLVTHEGVDGVLFTGSWEVGRRILEANLDDPGRIVALEMGGNNPALVMDDADLRQAVIECVRAAFVTTGQRCTCTRRIIVHEAVADRFVEALVKAADGLIVGDPRGIGGGSRNQPVFMGPIINESARDAILGAQSSLEGAGARVLLRGEAMPHPSGGSYLTPSVLEVDRFVRGGDASREAGCDEEFFGPLVRVSRCSSFEDGLEQANATRYGLASAVFTGSEETAGAFLDRAQAGCVNVNTGTAGASGALPFGGLGLSGNHRPAGSFSLDYCAYPVASLVETGDAAALLPGMTFDDGWIGG